MTNKNSHPFHIVSQSPWPILTATSMAMVLVNTTMMMWNIKNSLMMSMIPMLTCTAMWFRDIIRESTMQGTHTKKVVKGLQMGMILFILSEIMLFISLFWMLLHSSLSPSQNLGLQWPPNNITTFNPVGIPLLNTSLLLTSGFLITWSHFSLLMNHYEESYKAMKMTIMCGAMFLSIQMIEYMSAPFTMSDSIYGSAFFMITGFHGMHVMMGCTILIVALMRMGKKHLSSTHHFNYEAAAWYWHFVDVVWILVYMLMYF